MTKKILNLAAMAALVFAGSARMYAIDLEMVLSDGLGASITVDVTGGVIAPIVLAGGATATATYTTGAGLHVTGLLGQFSIDATGQGRLNTTSPSLENFNQINVTSKGAGTLTSLLTSTSYTGLGSSFLYAVSGVEQININTSNIAFAAFGSAANAIPAGTSIGAFATNSGNSFANSATFVNPFGATGSLTERAIASFTGIGSLQYNQALSTVTPVPEPTSVLLLGTALFGAAAFFRKRIQTKRS